MGGENQSIHKEIIRNLIRDLINEAGAEIARKTGVPLRALKEQTTKLKEQKRFVDEGKVDPAVYEKSVRDFEALKIKWLQISNSGGEDLEDMPIDIEVSKEMGEYVILNPDEVAEYSEKQLHSRSVLKDKIVEYISSLSPQAKPQKGVGLFLVRTIDSGEIVRYIRGTTRDNPTLMRFRPDSKKYMKIQIYL